MNYDTLAPLMLDQSIQNISRAQVKSASCQGPSLLLSRQWLLFKGMGISLTASLSLLLLLSQRFPRNHFVNFFASFLIVIRSVRRVATSQKSQQQARFYPSFTLYLNFSHKEERGLLFVSRHSDAAILGCHRAGKQQTTLLTGCFLENLCNCDSFELSQGKVVNQIYVQVSTSSQDMLYPRVPCHSPPVGLS